MPTIGYSTGALALGDFERAIEMLADAPLSAIELSALRSVELPGLLSAVSSHLDQWRSRYSYIALHAPTDAPDEFNLVESLRPMASQGINIVVHPDTIHDASLWRQLGSRLCIENMDSRKATGRTAGELRHFFVQLPDARLCFDIAHARQIDPTMTEAARILWDFGKRLAQVHLSEVNGQGRHFAMSFIAKSAYRPFAEFLSGFPVILESPVDESGIAHEIEEAKRVLAPLYPKAQAG